MKTIAYSLLALIGMCLIIALTGCAGYPVAIAVNGNYGTYSYSAKRGVEIAIDSTK